MSLSKKATSIQQPASLGPKVTVIMRGSTVHHSTCGAITRHKRSYDQHSQELFRPHYLDEAYASDESRTVKAAKVLPTFGPTEFKLSFIKAQESSYQAHLESCSDFPRPGIWWRKEGIGEDAQIINCDDPNDPDEHPEGSKIAHFRMTTIFAESAKIKELWHTVIDSKLIYSLANVRTYDENDNLKKIVSKIRP